MGLTFSRLAPPLPVYDVHKDERASAEQQDALHKIFGSQAGGQPQVLMGLVGQILGAKTARIDFETRGKGCGTVTFAGSGASYACRTGCRRELDGCNAGGKLMGFLSHLFGSALPALDARQAQARLHQKPAPFLLDVRQPEEYQAGHIEGARLIPLGELSPRLKELPPDAEILCVCRSGSRSARAAQLLSSRGYRALNLSGGMLAWTGAGFPVKQGPAR